MRRIVLGVAILALLGFSANAQQPGPAKTKSGPTEVTIGGAVTTRLSLAAADLKKMPRRTLRVDNAHSKKTEVYEGVLVEDLLKKAGVPLGEQLQGPAMASYVIVQAADDYHVVFSLAELDSGFQDSEVLMADTMDGAPITAGQGPFKLVAPHDKRPARWVRMVKSLIIVRAPN